MKTFGFVFPSLCCSYLRSLRVWATRLLVKRKKKQKTIRNDRQKKWKNGKKERNQTEEWARIPPSPWNPRTGSQTQTPPKTKPVISIWSKKKRKMKVTLFSLFFFCWHSLRTILSSPPLSLRAWDDTQTNKRVYKKNVKERKCDSTKTEMFGSVFSFRSKAWILQSSQFV